MTVFHTQSLGSKARVPIALGFLIAACLVLFSKWAAATQADEVTAGLSHPWAVAFIEEGRMLVSEQRPGQIRVVEANGKLSSPLKGLPKVDSVRAHRGLLDLVVDRNYKTNRLVYFCYVEADKNGGSTTMARARLSNDRSELEDVGVIFRQYPQDYSDHHFGCRIVQALDGHLFLTLGDREKHKEDAQILDNHHGKLVRVTTDGQVPAGNPFAGKAGALPQIWSYGHRNIQAAALSPSGALWAAEHGPLGGDELNLVLPGKNYGWPLISYGKEYDGRPIGNGLTHAQGMEQPVKHWSTIAPSGMAFATTDRYGAGWRGSILIASLRGSLLRLEMKADRVIREHTVWISQGERVRDVREAPDGTIYFLIDHPTNGRLMRLLP